MKFSRILVLALLVASCCGRNQAAREDAIRRLKDASTYSETARNVLEQLGMS